MSATVEQQRVGRMGVATWLEWRAVCEDHGSDRIEVYWMADETRTTWIEAQLDALEHDHEVHGIVPPGFIARTATLWPEGLAHLR